MPTKSATQIKNAASRILPAVAGAGVGVGAAAAAPYAGKVLANAYDVASGNKAAREKEEVRSNAYNEGLKAGTSSPASQEASRLANRTIDGLTSAKDSVVSGLTKAKDWVKQNPGTAAAGIGGVALLGGIVLYNKLKSKKQRQGLPKTAAALVEILKPWRVASNTKKLVTGKTPGQRVVTNLEGEDSLIPTMNSVSRKEMAKRVGQNLVLPGAGVAAGGAALALSSKDKSLADKAKRVVTEAGGKSVNWVKENPGTAAAAGAAGLAGIYGLYRLLKKDEA